MSFLFYYIKYYIKYAKSMGLKTVRLVQQLWGQAKFKGLIEHQKEVTLHLNLCLPHSQLSPVDSHPPF